ncbi:MAG: hypothetical protein V1905_02635 [bacterium]
MKGFIEFIRKQGVVGLAVGFIIMLRSGGIRRYYGRKPIVDSFSAAQWQN